MLKKLLQVLLNIANYCAPSTDPSDRVHANVVNISSMFGIGITVYYTLFYMGLGVQIFLPIIIGNCFIIPLYVFPIVFNRKGYFYLAKVAFFNIVMFQLAFDTGILGRDAGTHLFILALPTLGLLIFKQEETKSKIFCAVLSGIEIIAIHLLFPESLIGIYPQFIKITLYVFSITGMLSLQYLAIFIFSQRLKFAKNNLQIALDNMPGGILTVDEEKKVVLSNSKLIDLFNLNPSLLKEGQPLDKIIQYILENGSYDEKGVLKSVVDVLALYSDKKHSSITIHSADERVIEINTASTPYGGNVSISTDITLRKKMEEDLLDAKEKAEAGTKAKGEFLANMSHEIRTPMNAITGLTHLALETDLSLKQRDYLQKTEASAKSLLGLINDILDFSKIDAGKLDMEFVGFSLDEVIKNVSTLISVKSEEKGLGLFFQIPTSVPRFLIGDPLRLGQILINLSNNSVKFTEKGSVTIESKLIEASETTYKLQFAVKDTGIGLTKDQIGKLFKSFSQADSSTTRKFGGTGLGLTISKRLVEMMNGKIWVESEPGEGSAFIFTAEFGIGDEAEITASLQQKGYDDEQLKSIQGAKILIVEDNEINQQVAKEMLEKSGFMIDIAEDGQKAIEAVEQQSYDLVLMDIQMPVMDGYESTRIIRKSPKFKELPILAMSASAMTQDLKNSVVAGMNDHVAKPIELQQLFSALIKWIKPAAERTAVPKSLTVSGGLPVVDTPPEPAQAVQEEDELPESLLGFDLAAGLSRLMGNKRLYRKLLIDFGANYSGIAGEIWEALEAKDFKQAHSLVHNLKGLSGNLEATGLQAAAVEMEKLVKAQTVKTSSDKELKQKFTDLEKALEQALDAVQALGLPAEEKIIESSSEWLAEVPLERLKKVVDRINAAVEMGDVMQIQSIAEELKSKSDVVAPFCDKLVQLADDFDFDGIQKFMLNLNN
jgi:signal transduction histidine kinase/HPt (histidine-containing phosphotransfer) domain-containing protein/AmiR/NasT family two-component response regulator